METRIIEVSNYDPKLRNFANHGKFMLGRHTAEDWQRPSLVPGGCGLPLLRLIGTNPKCIWVLDLQTHEGASFLPGGYAHGDLEKHRVWVCPLFEPFLTWLYKQPDPWLIPEYVQLPPETPTALSGFRRPGPAG